MTHNSEKCSAYYYFIIKGVSEQPDEETHRARSRRVPGTRAFVPVELEGTTFPLHFCIKNRFALAFKLNAIHYSILFCCFFFVLNSVIMFGVCHAYCYYVECKRANYRKSTSLTFY